MGRGKAMTDNTKTNMVMVWIFLCLFLAGMATLLFIALYPFEPTKVSSFTIDKTQAYRGDMICYTIRGEKFYALPALVSIVLDNGESIEMMYYNSNVDVGLFMKKKCFIVPYHVIPNRYNVKWTALYPMFGRIIPVTVKSKECVDILEEKKSRGARGPEGRQGRTGERGPGLFGK
jgi:hypothetical protein